MRPRQVVLVGSSGPCRRTDKIRLLRLCSVPPVARCASATHLAFGAYSSQAYEAKGCHEGLGTMSQVHGR